MISKLNLNIREIGPEGRNLALTLAHSEVQELIAPSELPVAEGESRLDLAVYVARITDGTVVLSGSVSGQLWTECSRCLAPACITIDDRNLKGTFLPALQKAQADEPELELAEEDLDVAWHDGETLDLSEFIRDSLVLAVPIAPRCDERCPGAEERQEQQSNGADEMSPWKSQLARLRDDIKH